MKDWRDVHGFWFRQPPARWFGKDDLFDLEIREKFGAWLDHFEPEQYEAWKNEPKPLLSLVILLDQFPRNAFRGTARSFQYDLHALDAAREALDKGFDNSLSPVEAGFLVLPFEHSEDITDQKEAVRLARDLSERGAGKDLYEYAVRHHDIIQKFGRFPHRNAVLGRVSTPEEVEFLKKPGSSF